MELRMCASTLSNQAGGPGDRCGRVRVGGCLGLTPIGNDVSVPKRAGSILECSFGIPNGSVDYFSENCDTRVRV